MAKRIAPIVVALALVGYFGWRAWERKQAEEKDVSFYGTVEATEVLVSAQLAGRIVELDVDEGDTVSPGKLLVALDETLYQAQLEQAQAAQKAVEGQEPVVKANLDLLDLNLGRSSRLVAQNAAPRAPMEDLKKQREVLKAQQDAVKLQVEQAAAAANLAGKQLTYTKISAPVAGTVLRVHAELGETAFPGSALLTIADLSKVDIWVYVPEPMLGKIKLGDKVDLRTDSYPDRPLPAEVTYISDQAEFTPKNVQTKDERVRLVYGIKLTAANPDGILKIGMPVDAYFEKLMPPPEKGNDAP